MKNRESDYLNELFSKSSDDVGDTEIDFPLLDVPANLSDDLYAITGATLSANQSSGKHNFISWPKFASVAASLLMAIVLVQVYQQQKTLQQLEQAQTDLATALHYLGEANKITRAQVINSLNENMQKAGVAPVIEIGREAALQAKESREAAAKTQNRTL